MYFDVRHAIGGVWAHVCRTHYSITCEPSRRFFENFRPRDFLNSDKFKTFCQLCIFRLINHIKQAKHRRQLAYQDTFQRLKGLLLGVEKSRLKLEFFGCFCENTFTRILTFLFVNTWAIFRQTIAPKLSKLSGKTFSIDYFFGIVKFLRKLSIGAIFSASDEFSDYFTVFLDFANSNT